MPKPHTNPTLYNQALQIDISKLKEWGYLHPKQAYKGSINWSIEGSLLASISILVNTRCKTPYLELDYKHGKDPRNYKVKMVSIPSNLGKGLIWYFLCPETRKRCRKLYLIESYFLHREAFKGCMYETQTQSKKSRQLDKKLKAYFNADELYSRLHQKNFRKTYAGKPTKRYLRIIKQIQQAESIMDKDVRLMLRS